MENALDRDDVETCPNHTLLYKTDQGCPLCLTEQNLNQ